MREITFEVSRDEIDGGFVASASGYAIFTQADSMEGLRVMVKDAVHCHFHDEMNLSMPQLIRLRSIKEEIVTL